MLGKAVEGISYPFGRYNQSVLEAVREAGYKYGLTMNFPQSTDTDLTLGRLPVYGFDNHAAILRKLKSSRLYQFEKLKATITNRLSMGTILLNRLRKYG
jgi:hypothetical protein